MERHPSGGAPCSARRSIAALAAAVVLLTAPACGSRPEPPGGAGAAATTTSSTPDATSASPTSTTTATTATTPRQPQRIIPLEGDLAEIVFALGLGHEVVATDLSASYPPEADALPEIGYQRALSSEPIVAFAPTILLATDLAGPPETLDELRNLGIEIVTIPDRAAPDGPAEKIRAVGAALGVADRAEALAREVQIGIDDAMAVAAEAAERDGRPRVAALYLRGERVQIVFGKGSGIDWIIDAAGGIDVGTELGIDDNAPLSTEALLVAAPDVLLASTTGAESVGGAAGVLALPGLDRTPAGAAGRVVTFEDQFLFGGGPRTPELIRQLSAALHPDPAGDSAAPTTTKG